MKSALDFLAKLKKNNNREWMADHKPAFEAAKKEFEKLVGELISEVGEFDQRVAGLQPKDCIFRVHRDVRFSKDKRPYKANFGAAINNGGKKAAYPTYYLHAEPGGSFVAGGLYMPPADILKKVRQEIDYSAKDLLDVVNQNSFKTLFGKLEGESLKTAPKGYDVDHPNIKLLRMKSFLAVHKINDADLTGASASSDVAKIFREIKPLNEFLGRAFE